MILNTFDNVRSGYVAKRFRLNGWFVAESTRQEPSTHYVSTTTGVGNYQYQRHEYARHPNTSQLLK